MPLIFNRESVPAMRFIGKKYPAFGGWWGEWFAKGWFDQIENAGVRQMMFSAVCLMVKK